MRIYRRGGSCCNRSPALAVHIREKFLGNDTVMAQVENNAREQALKADLPDAATNAIVEAMGSHEKMATRLLSDEGARDIFLGLLYEMLKQPDAPSLLAGESRRTRSWRKCLYGGYSRSESFSLDGLNDWVTQAPV